MINSTTIKVPKKYQSMISEITKDSDGYWCHTAEGYYSPDMDCHTIHEDTQKDLLAKIRNIQPCNCKDCQSTIAEQISKDLTALGHADADALDFIEDQNDITPAEEAQNYYHDHEAKLCPLCGSADCKNSECEFDNVSEPWVVVFFDHETNERKQVKLYATSRNSLEILFRARYDGEIRSMTRASEIRYNPDVAWSEQPLPIRCSRWRKTGKLGVPKSVIFDVYLEDYRQSVKVDVHFAGAFKMLCAQGKPNFHSITAVRWYDGSISFAKWRKDTETGCYIITDLAGNELGRQGGYELNIPRNCYKNREGEWKLKSNPADDTYNYSYCLV